MEFYLIGAVIILLQIVGLIFLADMKKLLRELIDVIKDDGKGDPPPKEGSNSGGQPGGGGGIRNR